MRRHNRTQLECVCERLFHSRNPDERNSLFVGRTVHQGFPVLLDRDLLFEHMHIVGPTGIGKSTLGLHTDTVQLIHQGDGAVVIFDGKGDPALFHAVREATARTGRTLKWFTNKPHRSTYIFNPWNQKSLSHLTLADILGLFTQGLNVLHGEDYGRAWFSSAARALLRRGILATIPDAPRHNLAGSGGRPSPFPRYGPIQSFHDLYHIVRDLSANEDELKAGQHLCFLIESLTDFEQLNLAPSQNPNHPALAHAIHMPEVIREKQVVYFYMAGGADLATTGMLIKLALFALLTAANAYLDEHGTPAKVYAVVDEAQVVIAKNIANVLAMARSAGISMILAHQAMSQLNPPGGVDLREIVMACTAIKQIFGVRDPWLMDYISRTSGTTRYFSMSYDVLPEYAMAGVVGPDVACPDSDGIPRINIHEYTGPRLTNQDILDASRNRNTSLIWIDRAAGLSRFHGWFPLYTDWPATLADHQRRSQLAWPDQSEETITMATYWPSGNEQTIVPTTHPRLALTEEDVDASAKLRALRRKLEEK